MVPSFSGDLCRLKITTAALWSSGNGDSIADMEIAEFEIDAGKLQNGIFGHVDLVFLHRIRDIAAAAAFATAATPAAASSTTATTLTSPGCGSRFSDFPNLNDLFLGIDF